MTVEHPPVLVMDLVEVVRGPKRPSAQLEAKVKAGKLGRKTKEGWYKYE